MKTLGLIGGMSWESSLEYYRLINLMVKEQLGEPHSCQCIMYSVDFAEFERLQHQGEWIEMTAKMTALAEKLEAAGAEILLICTNTMHKMADDVQGSINIPLLHIADAAAEEIKNRGMKRVGLLGTRFTMEQDFYKKRLQERHGIEVIIPPQEERILIHRVIYEELIAGIFKEESRTSFQEIIGNLRERGAEGVILGCTEIPLLIREGESSIPVFNTTRLHAEKAVELALT